MRTTWSSSRIPVLRIVFASLFLAIVVPLAACHPQPDSGASASLHGDTALCDVSPEEKATRPRWGEVKAPPGKPDYVNVGENITVDNSLQLIASMVQKAVTKLRSVRSEVQKSEAHGQCLCEGVPAEVCGVDELPCEEVLSPDDLTRAECDAACKHLADPDGNPSTDDPACGATGVVTGWRLDDTYFTPRMEARKALGHIKWLDRILTFITSDAFGKILKGAANVADVIENVQQLIALTLHYTNEFTEGFHLGAYSNDRKDLHYCVPRGGSGAYASMLGLGGGRFSIGARYWSGLAAKKVHGLFETGGFALSANGKEYTFLPGASFKVQIDGFRFWDRNKFFGIDVGASSEPGAGLDLAKVDKLDVFNLVDSSLASSLDSDGDGKVRWNEFFLKSFYPVDYVSAVDGTARVWPRTEDDASAENTSTAVFGAGLNMPLRMKPIDEALPSIPIVPGVTVTPRYRLAAGLDWHYTTNKLLSRIQDKLNANLAAPQQLQAGSFAREMHAMQAPDVSDDKGVSGQVDPGVSAELQVGFNIGKFLRIGAFAFIGLDINLAPSAHGGVVDASRGLAEMLAHVNPDPSLPCRPVLTQSKGVRCSNTASEGKSTALYGCESGLALRADSASNCESYGYCLGKGGTMADAVHDVAEVDCRGTWYPYICTETTTAELSGWEGPGCHPLTVGFGADAAAQAILGMAGSNAPLHSIFTYALSDFLFKALLNAGISVELRVKLFGFTKTFKLFSWSDSFDVGSTNKTWFQMGLEATYHDDCSEPGHVINHQKDHVTRYPNEQVADWSRFDRTDELIQAWCYPTVKEDDSYSAYKVPDGGDIVDSVSSAWALGKDVGSDMWQGNQLCIGGETIWSWVGNQHGSMTKVPLFYDLPDGSTVQASFEDLEQVLAQSLGCIPAITAPPGAPTLISGGKRYVNLGALVPPGADELEWSRFYAPYTTSAWSRWYQQVTECFAKTFDSSRLHMGALKVEACCGDGVVQAPEACDDGNRVNDDKCSNSCTRTGAEEALPDPVKTCTDLECLEWCATQQLGDAGRCKDRSRSFASDNCACAWR